MNFLSCGATSLESMVFGSFKPQMRLKMQAIIIVTIAPKQVYHMYDILYRGLTSLEEKMEKIVSKLLFFKY